MGPTHSLEISALLINIAISRSSRDYLEAVLKTLTLLSIIWCGKY